MVQSAVRQVYEQVRLKAILVYWTMKNCGGDADQLCNGILNIVKHYQVHYCVSNVQDIGD